MQKQVNFIEKVIFFVLTMMMLLVVILSTVKMGYVIITRMFSQNFFIDLNGLTEIFGLFLLVLVGIELLETIKSYIFKNEVHLQVVLMTAIIAISRKIILIDFDKMDPVSLVGIGVILVALSISVYITRFSNLSFGELYKDFLGKGKRKSRKKK
ncbi:MAG: phosphate-starvation-inducible E-like protein [Candidatus Aenigmarchaeota archaeon]|nr:phosphate-starvation-inducible E-like protein [Candidatus Aenigmarchaeota archaeon]